jgi:hypothetical protein
MPTPEAVTGVAFDVTPIVIGIGLFIVVCIVAVVIALSWERRRRSD